MLSSSSALAPDLSAAHVFAPSSTVNFRLYPGGVHHPAYSSVYPPAIQHPTLLRLRRPNPISGKPQTRGYATQTPSPLTLQVFNAATKHQQRERAASDAETSRRVDYLRDEVAGRLCERLLVDSSNSLRYMIPFAIGTHSISSRLGHGEPRISNATSHISSILAPMLVMSRGP